MLPPRENTDGGRSALPVFSSRLSVAKGMYIDLLADPRFCQLSFLQVVLFLPCYLDCFAVVHRLLRKEAAHAALVPATLLLTIKAVANCAGQGRFDIKPFRLVGCLQRSSSSRGLDPLPVDLDAVMRSSLWSKATGPTLIVPPCLFCLDDSCAAEMVRHRWSPRGSCSIGIHAVVLRRRHHLLGLEEYWRCSGHLVLQLSMFYLHSIQQRRAWRATWRRRERGET